MPLFLMDILGLKIQYPKDTTYLGELSSRASAIIIQLRAFQLGIRNFQFSILNFPLSVPMPPRALAAHR
jgi:hypothetical protein